MYGKRASSNAVLEDLGFPKLKLPNDHVLKGGRYGGIVVSWGSLTKHSGSLGSLKQGATTASKPLGEPELYHLIT